MYTGMSELTVERFSWERHSEIVKGFHEDILISNIQPKHMSTETYLQLLRGSESHGLPAYMRGLREACEAGEDGMFIWRIEEEVVGWSWLRVYENEFFEEGIYGEINEIYVAAKRRGKGIGKAMMTHAYNWFRERRVRVIRVEALASNETAVRFYKKFGFEPNYIIFQKFLSEEEE